MSMLPDEKINGDFSEENDNDLYNNPDDISEHSEETEIDLPRNKKNKKKKFKRFKLILIIAVIAIVVAAILYLIALFNSGEGEKLAKKIPIGRNIEYAEKQTGVTFSETSQYNQLEKILDFDYVYECNKSVKISGVTLPEWVIMITKNPDGLIETVTYYDFAQLQKSWKGYKTNKLIENTDVQYGMSALEVKNALGVKPYYIETGIDNSVTYVYRYYFVDPETNNDVVMNYYVVFNDVNDSVKLVYSKEIDFTAYLLRVE